MKLLSSLALVILLFIGTGMSCLHGPVPSNHFRGTIGGVPFELDTKKQTSAKNIEFTVQSILGSVTNFSTLKIGEISGVNDPQVIDKSYAGQVALEKARWEGLNSALEKAAKGTAAGATGK